MSRFDFEQFILGLIASFLIGCSIGSLIVIILNSTIEPDFRAYESEEIKKPPVAGAAFNQISNSLEQSE